MIPLEFRKTYEEKRLQILANLMRDDAMNYTEIYKALGVCIGNLSPILRIMVDTNDLTKTKYMNVTLYHLPNTPQEVVKKIREEKYKPFRSPSALKIARRNQALKRREYSA